MTNPITPDDMKDIEIKKPDFVIKAFNKLIKQNWNGISATIKQEDVVNEICSETSLPSHNLFLNHYLDVEPVYRAAGWKVTYDKPGYNETPYPPTFTFSIADSKRG